MIIFKFISIVKMIIFKFILIGLRLGCSNLYFKCQNKKTKIKNIIVIIFWFNLGGSFEPLGSK